MIPALCKTLALNLVYNLQMTKVLKFVAKKEKINLPEETANSIILEAKGNMRKALLVFEALRMQRYVFRCGRQDILLMAAANSPDMSSDIEIAKPDWETYCGKIADLIVQEQSPKRLLEIRGKIYELLSHCIPPTVILKVSRIELLLLSHA
jgi:replication factor C subunit 3/5